MKIIVRLSFLIFIPIIVGTALALSGYSVGSWILALGVPGVMLILVITGLIMMMKGKLFNKPSDNDESEKEREQSAINDINDSKFYTNQFKLAAYEADQIVKGTENSSKKGLAAGIIFFLLLVALAVLATVFTIKQIWVGAIVCAALFGGTIITILITVAIRESIAMRKNISKAKKISCGRVKSCVLSSMSTTKSVTPTVRIQNVVYRIVVSADGAEYATFSRQFYETDEQVVIAVMGKKRVKIINEADLEGQSEELKSKYADCLNNDKTDQ